MPGFIRSRILILVCVLMGGIGWTSSAYLQTAPDRIISQDDWLPAGAPCEVLPVEFSGNLIGMADSELIADIPLEPGSPVQLLISSLSSVHNIAVTATVEEISGPPVFRPARIPSGASAIPVYPIEQRGTLPDLPRSIQATTRLPAVEDGRVPAPNREFWVHVTAGSLEDRNAYQSVTGILANHRNSVEVYVDRTVSGSAEVRRRASQIAELLESEVLPALQQFVGPIEASDGSRNLTVLLTPWLGRLQGGMTSVKGFVRGSDFQSELRPPFSNQSATLYLNTELPQGAALKTLLLHEVAHAALFSHPAFGRPNAIAIEDWLNEGLAHLAERRLGGDWSNLDYRIARFYQSPGTAPLAVEDYYRSSRWRDHGCRGASFLFLDKRLPPRTNAVYGLTQISQRRVSLAQQAEFERSFRNWAISLARRSWTSNAPQKVGRFLNSGPRFHRWSVTKQREFPFQVSGTATQFITLTTTRRGWFRLRIPDQVARGNGCVTVIKMPSDLADITVSTNWIAQDESQATPEHERPRQVAERSLVVTFHADLAPGWNLSAAACEGSLGDDQFVRNFHFEPDGLLAGGVPVRRLNHGVAVTLPMPGEIPQRGMVLKIRLHGPEGQVAWIWDDVPELHTPAGSPTIAGGSQFPGQRR